MAQDEQRPERQRNLEIQTDDLRPYVTYRNPKDDKIQLALQEAERRLRAQGKPLVRETKKD